MQPRRPSAASTCPPASPSGRRSCWPTRRDGQPRAARASSGPSASSRSTATAGPTQHLDPVRRRRAPLHRRRLLADGGRGGAARGARRRTTSRRSATTSRRSATSPACRGAAPGSGSPRAEPPAVAAPRATARIACDGRHGIITGCDLEGPFPCAADGHHAAAGVAGLPAAADGRHGVLPRRHGGVRRDPVPGLQADRVEHRGRRDRARRAGAADRLRPVRRRAGRPRRPAPAAGRHAASPRCC